MSERTEAKGTTAETETAPTASNGVVVSRRKLVYAAPILMSKRLFYRASGCGKVDPQFTSCQSGNLGS